jgi:polysaccharide export outer membrane protein
VLRGSDDPMEFDSLTAWQLNTKNAAALTLATRFELRPNDIIFVAEQPVTKWNRVINQITPSLITSGVSAIN